MFKHLRLIFLQGLVAVLPLAVTLFVLVWLASWAERLFALAAGYLLPPGWYYAGMGLAAGIVLIFLVGLALRVWGVPRAIALAERLIARIPLIKTIYGAVKDLLGYFSQPASAGPNKVVMVSLFSPPVRILGLVTREHFPDLPPGTVEPGHVAVYIPYSYQIGGFTVFLPKDQLEPVDLPLEEAMRFIVTAGAQKSPSSESPSLSSAQ